MLLSVVSPLASPGSQSPCSSIATLPFASMPAELVGLLCAATALNPGSNGFVARNAVRSFVALEKHGALMFDEVMPCWMTEVEHSLTAKYSHQNASGH